MEVPFADFLIKADYKMFLLHDPAVDALDPRLPARSGEVVADEYELLVRTTQDSARVRVILAQGHDRPAEADLLGKAAVTFPEGELIISEGGYGRQGPVALPEGAGRYEISVWVNTEARAEAWTETQRAIREERDLPALHSRLTALDGVDWYQLLFVRTTEQPSLDDDEEDE
jgi:hypothetical protein